jgi:hypothetical protein
METEEKRKILEEFLERWPESVVRAMTLSDYVGVEDKDTFTYWVETKTRSLGSIKGWDSIKFGIYLRSKPEKRNKNHQNDDAYTWMARFGTNRTEAFKAVKQDILDIIKFAETGAFAKIDGVRLPDLFKWKVASLYSNERLVPIFKRDVLSKIAAAYGLTNSQQSRVSEIQSLLISRKPTEQDIYAHMSVLYEQYGTDHHKQGSGSAVAPPPGTVTTPRPTRKGAATKNTATQIRSGARSYIADQKHNKIQMALRQKLIIEHGEAALFLEKNWVDVKVLLPEEIVFYEVKSASYAGDCVKEALGQVLAYVFKDEDPRKKRIVVVGQYPANKSDQNFIDYIRSLLSIEFSYEHIDI